MVGAPKSIIHLAEVDLLHLATRLTRGYCYFTPLEFVSGHSTSLRTAVVLDGCVDLSAHVEAEQVLKAVHLIRHIRGPLQIWEALKNLLKISCSADTVIQII